MKQGCTFKNQVIALGFPKEDIKSVRYIPDYYLTATNTYAEAIFVKYCGENPDVLRKALTERFPTYRCFVDWVNR